jgi:hypothetical protein
MRLFHRKRQLGYEDSSPWYVLTSVITYTTGMLC